MRAYKGFNGNLTCTKGNGTYRYEAGETYFTEASQTARTGFHCCENPMDCLTWYGLPLGKNNSRIFVVEAAGDIDEIEDKIACTQITLLKELDLKQLTFEVMKYIILHPYREWPRIGKLFEVAEDCAEAVKDGFAIARGVNPIVKGEEGSVLGILVEHPGNNAEFLEAKVGIVGIDIEPGIWYTVQDGEWKARNHEEKVG